MMPAVVLQPSLRVEGINDLHAIGSLVLRYGIDYKTNPSAPKIEQNKGITALVDGIESLIELGNGRTFGFVLDADKSPIDRWASVRQRLANAGVTDLPGDTPEAGFVGESPRWRSRVGVWLMPDNRRPGTLEEFLRELISEEDPIIDHARSATEQAKSLGARYREVAFAKATLHAWLAWQEDPGLPYGSAITARYFRHDHPIARRFVDWYCKLYQLPPVV